LEEMVVFGHPPAKMINDRGLPASRSIKTMKEVAPQRS